MKNDANFVNNSKRIQLTLNRNASLSYELSALSTKAFAKQIGCCRLMRSSADIELWGLPGRTNACVPVQKMKYGWCQHQLKAKGGRFFEIEKKLMR